jgi:hypothetical protein
MKLSKHWQRQPRSLINRLHIDDIAPDGVRFDIDWDLFKVGSSIFIPCVNTEELVREVAGVMTRRGWEVEFFPRIENGVWGVRFFRMV